MIVIHDQGSSAAPTMHNHHGAPHGEGRKNTARARKQIRARLSLRAIGPETKKDAIEAPKAATAKTALVIITLMIATSYLCDIIEAGGIL